MSKYIFLGMIMGLITLSTYGQNIITDSLQWNSGSAVNQDDNSVLNYNCSFTTHDTSIDWSQAEGKKVTHFTATSIDGQWTDVTLEGRLTYQIQKGNISGTLSFARINGELSAHLKLIVDGKPDLDYVFLISSISTPR